MFLAYVTEKTEFPLIAKKKNGGRTSSIRGKKRTNKYPSEETEKGLNSLEFTSKFGDVSLSHLKSK